jgi:hypothetical protein
MKIDTKGQDIETLIQEMESITDKPTKSTPTTDVNNILLEWTTVRNKSNSNNVFFLTLSLLLDNILAIRSGQVDKVNADILPPSFQLSFQQQQQQQHLRTSGL